MKNNEVTARNRNISVFALIIVWKSIPKEGKRQCKRKKERETTEIREKMERYFSAVMILM